MDLRTTRTIRSAIEIRAPIATVWGVLTDFSAYPDWNPHIRKVQGEAGDGVRISIHTQPPGGRMIVMRPTVITWTPPNELRWRSTFLGRNQANRALTDTNAANQMKQVERPSKSNQGAPGMQLLH